MARSPVELPRETADAALPPASGRRVALRHLATAGMTFLATLGWGNGVAANRGPHHQQVQAEKKKHKGTLSTQVQISVNSNPLPITAGSSVSAFVPCGGEGTVVSCGYQTTTNAAQLVNAFVDNVAPNTDRSACAASLIRTTETGSTAGATIQAIAVCLI